MPLGVGDLVPGFTVLRAHQDPVTAEELWSSGPTIVVYYVFDFSGAEGG